jgi:autotransporter strand-loop-strand O-heptosyltransferase
MRRKLKPAKKIPPGHPKGWPETGSIQNDLPASDTLNKALYGFICGASFEVLGDQKEDYHVKFTDVATGRVLHESIISNNHWTRTARQYFTQWKIEVFRLRDNAPIFVHEYRACNRRVYIAFESKSLGDTLAWFPAVDRFRQAHECHVICSTFWNHLFQDQYPEIHFVEPGTTVHDLYAMYSIGWFQTETGEIDPARHPTCFRNQPLAKSAYDILGLPFENVKPRITCPPQARPVRVKYACIAVHSTAQAKYWNNPSGWQDLVNYLNGRGYQVFLLSKEGHQYMNNVAPREAVHVPEGPIQHLIAYLKHADIFIGVGSGLSWLSWAVGCPTCIISGFSLPFTEPSDCIRIVPEESICSGCFNKYYLNPDDWNWCPEHSDNPSRRFECSKSISAAKVIEAIKPFLR